MKKLCSILSAAVLTTALAITGSVEADTTVEFGIGYRTDDISWKLDAPSTLHPDTFSKLHFKDLEIFAIHGRIKSRCGDCFYYRVDGTYGWILDGTVRESDRLSRNIDQDCSECIAEDCADESTENSFCGVSPFETISVHPKFCNNVKHKYVADFDIALGYPLDQCWCPNLQVVPAIGFIYSTQRLRANEHHTASCAIEEESGDQVNVEAYGLESGVCDHERSHGNFRTTWWGPWIGLDLAYSDGGCWNVYGEFEYFFGRARAQRNSNYTLDAFNNRCATKWANGYSFRVGSHYYFRCNWLIDGFVTYKRYHSHGHEHSLTWRAIGVGLALGYTF